MNSLAQPETLEPDASNSNITVVPEGRMLRSIYRTVFTMYTSGFQTGVRGPKGVRDGFPRGLREDSEKQ